MVQQATISLSIRIEPDMVALIDRLVHEQNADLIGRCGRKATRATVVRAALEALLLDDLARRRQSSSAR